MELAIGHAKNADGIEAAMNFAFSDAVRNCDQLYILSEIACTSPELQNNIVFNNSYFRNDSKIFPKLCRIIYDVYSKAFPGL